MIAKTPDDCEWYTPPEILDLIYQVMDIDLDPASPYPATVLARKHYTKETDGLSKPWRGNVFLNPPYGREVGKWIDKLEEEWKSCHIKNAIILIHAKTDTKWFGKIADMAAEMCCWRGRISFQNPEGKNGKGTFPSLPFSSYFQQIKKFGTNSMIPFAQKAPCGSEYTIGWW